MGRGYVQPTHLQGMSLSVVGWKTLQTLLQPRHSFFAGKEGLIEHFSLYKDGKRRCFAYPRVKAPAGNPYKLHRQMQKCVGKTLKRIKALMESNGMERARLIDQVFTFPKELSEYLASKGVKGGQSAWRLWQRFFAEDLEPLLLRGKEGSLGAYVNLHSWKTENPFEPHFHFHCLMLDWFLNAEGKFEELDFPKNSVGTEVVWADDELEMLKECWRDKVNKLCRRHGLPQVPAVDIHVGYVAWDGADELGKAQFLNRFNYQSRNPLEDFADYSNKNPSCGDPPDWLLYSNKSRVFGFWGNLKQFIGVNDADDKTKLSPLSGAEMDCLGRLSVWGLLQLQDVWGLDFCRGKPRFCRFGPYDFNWVKEVSLVRLSLGPYINL